MPLSFSSKSYAVFPLIKFILVKNEGCSSLVSYFLSVFNMIVKYCEKSRKLGYNTEALTLPIKS